MTNNNENLSSAKKSGFVFEWESLPKEEIQNPFGSYLLRGWQKNAFEELKDSPHMIINAPMGSGKSWMMCFLSAFKLKQEPSLLCIITVPQTIIAPGFIENELTLPDGEKISWNPKHYLCTNANKGTIEYVTKWLSSEIETTSREINDRILVCTHATMSSVFKKLYKDGNLRILSNLLLWIDEAHHISISKTECQDNNILVSNSLGKLVSHMFRSKDLNNQIGLATATYFRGDRRDLLTKDMHNQFKRYNLPYDEHLKSMTHLKSFSYDFVISGSHDYLNSIEEVIKEKKKDIIYIPRPNSLHSTGDKYKEVDNITSLYKKIHGPGKVHILDLVDDDTTSRNNNKNYINESTINKNRESLDTIIALGMFKEGANWIWAERIIIIGSRSSLVDIIQMIGRLFRDAPGKSHVEIVQILPFSLDQKDEEQFAVNLNNYLKAIYASMILENILDPVKIDLPYTSTSNKKDSADSSGNDVKSYLNSEITDADKISLLFNEAAKQVQIANLPPEASHEEFVKVVEKVVEENVLTNHKKEIAEEIIAVWKRRSRALQIQGISVDDIDFNIVQKASPLHPMDFILKYTSGISDINTFQKLREAIYKGRPPLTEEIIKECMRSHKKLTGKWPKRSSGDVHGMPEETWDGFDDALIKGLRGLSGGSSLARLGEELGRRNRKNLPPFTKELIKTWAIKHFERTGEWPNAKSGPIFESPDDDWAQVDQAFIKGLRGLEKGSSLKQFLEAEFDLGRPDLDLERLEAIIKSHFDETGEWLNRESKSIPGMPNENGITIDDALRQGKRGLPKSSLPQLRQKLGGDNHKGRPKITIPEILAWADEHYRNTGDWPNEYSGIVTAAPYEITWSAINTALRVGWRGFSGGITLVKLLSTEHGIRQRNNPPNLTLEQIKNAMQSHKKRTGEWPNRDSGSIPELPGETWAGVISALYRGSRGLPKGYNLSKLRKEIEAEAMLIG